MKKILLSLTLLSVSILLFAQTDSLLITEPDKDEILVTADVMPEFPGGNHAMRVYIAENIKYPKQAKETATEGMVYVRFVVQKDGNTGKVEIMRGIDPLLDREAVSVIKSLPKFEPGRKNGKPVSVWMTVPIHFSLDTEKE